MELTVYVPDMHCRHCEQTLATALKNYQHSLKVTIDLARKTIHLAGSFKEEAILTVISDCGFTPEIKK